MTITTRELVSEGIFTKNSPLTYAELDQNFVDLVQWNINHANNLDPHFFSQSSNNAVERTTLDKLRDVLNVKDFGAIGNGIANDTDALNLSFTAAAQSGQTLYIPSGTYMVSNTIGTLLTSSNKDINVVCDPSVILKAASNFPANIKLIYFNTTGGSHSFRWQGGTIDGRLMSTKTQVSAPNVFDIDGFGYVSKIDITNIKIIQNDTRNGTAGDSCLNISGCDDVCVTNSIFQGAVDGGFYLTGDITSTYGRRCYIAGNTFLECKEVGFISKRQYEDHIIDGNFFVNCGISCVVGGEADSTKLPGKKAIISNNIVRNVSRGLELRISDNSIITGNKIEDYGIEYNGNIIGEVAILISGSNNCIITNNTTSFSGKFSPNAGAFPVKIRNIIFNSNTYTSQYNLISSNNFKGYSKINYAVVEEAGNDNNEILNNVVDKFVFNPPYSIAGLNTNHGQKLNVFGADPILTIQDKETGLNSANSKLRLAESGSGGIVDNYWDMHFNGSDRRSLSFSYNAAKIFQLNADTRDIKLQPTTRPTLNIESGELYYDSSSNKLYCYDGSMWNTLFNNVKNVKDFGVKGNGITDDTQNLIVAFETGGTIYIPEGDYLIAANGTVGGVYVNFTKSLHVICSANTRFFTNGVHRDFFNFLVPTDGTGLDPDGITFEWEGGYIDQTNQKNSTVIPHIDTYPPYNPGTYPTSNGISIRGTYFSSNTAYSGIRLAKVSNVSFYAGSHWQVAGGDSGLTIGNGSQLSIVENCSFTGNRDVGVYGSWDPTATAGGPINIKNNKFINCFFGSAIKRSARNFDVSDNYYQNCVGAINIEWIVGTGCAYGSIKTNKIYSCTTGIRVLLGTGIYIAGNVFVNSGSFDNNNNKVYVYNNTFGIGLYGCIKCNVTNNISLGYNSAFSTYNPYFMLLDSYTPTGQSKVLSKYNIITNNQIDSWYGLIKEETNNVSYNQYYKNYASNTTISSVQSISATSYEESVSNNLSPIYRNQQLFVDGNINSPIIANYNQTNTGIYFPNATSIGLTANGIGTFITSSNSKSYFSGAVYSYNKPLTTIDDVAGSIPTLDLDFSKQIYRYYTPTEGLREKSLLDIITVTRESNGSFYDAKGILTTSTNNIPRLNFDTVTGECKGILIESARINRLKYSEQFNQSAWGSVRRNIFANTVISPDNTLTGDKLSVDTTPTTTHSIFQTYDSFVSGTAYTFSVYAKAGEFSQINLRFGGSRFLEGNVYYNLQNGTKTVYGNVINSSIINIGNGWYKCSFTQIASSSGSDGAYIYLASSGTIIIPVANGTDGVYIWGAQLEEGNSESSYIKTESSAVHRYADIVSIANTAFDSFYKQLTGSLLINYKLEQSNTNICLVHINDTTSNNSIVVRYTSGSLAQYYVNSNGINQTNFFPSGYSSINTHKRAIAFSTNSFQQAIDGILPGSEDTSGTVPITSQLIIGSYGTGEFINGHISRITYWPSRLSNITLQNLTAL